MALSPERAASEEAAKEAALRILTRGPRTEHEVGERLLARGFDQNAVERAVQRLRRVSLLDDRAFTRSFLRTELTRAPQGRRLLEMKLKRRGVPPAIVQEIGQLMDEDPDLKERTLATEEGRAVAALTQLKRRSARLTPDVYRRRMERALARRGFAWELIRDLLGEEAEGTV